jgi:Flp pilus assembly CpaF family ATPase
MLMAMSQGNNGSMCTMHADSARSVFPKLAAYMSMASTGVPTETLNLLIASSVHLVVHVINREGRRGIDSIHEIVDTDGLSIVTNEVFSAASPSAPFGTLRQGTSTLLREHGFHASREMAWVAS